MGKKIILTIVVLIIAVVVLMSVFSAPEEMVKYTGPVEKITVGATTQEASTIIWIAKEKGYFIENGLEATIKPYDTGIETKNALFAGEVDVTDTIDFVMTNLALEEVGFKTIASIGEVFMNYITARKDRDISNLSDLKGKKIAIKEGSSSEYYIGRTLLLEGLSLKDVELVPAHPTDMAEMIAQGLVDATITWAPHNYAIKEKLGDNAIVWPAYAQQAAFWGVISTNEFIQENPEKIKRFLKALIQAEEFIADNDLESREIISKLVNLDLKHIESVWSNYHFVVNLTQSMILGMEDQARWKIENNLTDKTKTPNYLDYIYTDALKEIEPKAVTIIY